jgi:hypothetical protein
VTNGLCRGNIDCGKGRGLGNTYTMVAVVVVVRGKVLIVERRSGPSALGYSTCHLNIISHLEIAIFVFPRCEQQRKMFAVCVYVCIDIIYRYRYIDRYIQMYRYIVYLDI